MSLNRDNIPALIWGVSGALMIVALLCSDFHVVDVRIFGTPPYSYFGFHSLKPFSGRVLFHLGNLAYLFWTSWLGLRLFVDPFFSNQIKKSRFLALLAGFLPGYLIVVGINRLASLFIPSHAAAILVLAGAAISLGCLLFRSVSSERHHGLSSSEVVIGILILAFCFIYSVQFGKGQHLTGDGTKLALDLVSSPRFNFESGTSFPVTTQHNDEILFLFPPVYVQSLDLPRDFPFLIWCLMSFVRVGSLFLVFFSFLALKLPKRFCIFLTVLMHFGWFFFSVRHPILFDSGNPTFFTMHAGHIIAQIGFIVFLGAFVASRGQRPSFRGSGLIWGLALIGISMCSISNLVWVLVCLIAAWVFPAVLARRRPVENWIQATSPISLFLFISPAVIYSSQSFYEHLGFWISLVMPLWLSALFFYFAAFPNFDRLKQGIIEARYLRVLGFTLLVLCFALIFLGNVFSGISYRKLGLASLLGITPIEVREQLNPLANVGGFSILGGNSFRYKDIFLGSSIRFLYCYGFLILVSIGGLVLAKSRRFFLLLRDSSEAKYLYAGLWTATVFFFLSLVGYEYTNGYVNEILQAWVKSRFLEIWYPPALAMGISVIYLSVPLSRRKYIVWGLSLFCLAPALFLPNHSMLVQFWKNLCYLLS